MAQISSLDLGYVGESVKHFNKEMAQISSLDLGYVGESVKHFNPEFVRGCLAVKIHD